MATTRIRIKRGIASAWSSANPVLGAGELGYDTTNRVLKVGDGVTAWNSLPGIDFDGASFDAEDIGFDDSGLTVVEGADVQEALASIDAELAAASSSYGSKAKVVRLENLGYSSAVGTWVTETYSTSPGMWAVHNDAADAQNDELTWTVDIAAGTYALRWVQRADVNQAIVTVLVDGVSVGTADGYAAANAIVQRSVTGFVIATPGEHTVTMRMATRNASATGWRMCVNDITLVRTAPLS
jgi:hypothetical protein